MVKADFASVGDFYAFIDDCSFDPDMSANLNVFEQDRVFNKAVAVNLAARSQDRPANGGPTDDAAAADVGIEVLAAAAFLIKHRFGRRVIALIGDDRPPVVVEIELWHYVDQIHIGLIVGVNGPDILPVAFFPRTHLGQQVINKVIGKDAVTLFDHHRDNMFAKVKIGVVFPPLFQYFNKLFCGKNVIAHRGKAGRAVG
ncbi:MAG: hypothetical protein K0R22_824, partial [Sporomusa sp.]|nr:hypothetical protein [Sporomusa sp.]